MVVIIVVVIILYIIRIIDSIPSSLVSSFLIFTLTASPLIPGGDRWLEVLVRFGILRMLSARGGSRLQFIKSLSQSSITMNKSINITLSTSMWTRNSSSSTTAATPSSTDSNSINYSDFRKSLSSWIKKDIIPNIGEWEKNGYIPRSVYKDAAKLGIFSSGYPIEYGGLGDNMNDYTIKKIIIEELCKIGSGGFIASLCIHSISLPPILLYGNQIIKEKIIPSVINGDAICALCVTEPSGGSDVANIQTTAILQSNGTYVLNGIKTFITSGIQANYYTIAARTIPIIQSSNNKLYSGISLFAIDANLPGITKISLDKMGWLCSDTATIYFQDVIISSESLIGTINEGFTYLMKNFNSERILLSLQSYYFSVNIYHYLVQYTQSRKVFQKRLLSNQVIQHQLIDIYSKLYANEIMLNDVLELYYKYGQDTTSTTNTATSSSTTTATSADTIDTSTTAPTLQQKELNKQLIIKIAILKNFTTDTFHEVANRGVQILGGAGYIKDNYNIIERLYRETKVMQIGGGSTEIMKELIGKYLGFHDKE